jgi:hypothetical protein
MDISNLLKIFIVGMSTWAFFWEIMEAIRLTKVKASHVWIKYAFAIICLYWCGYYILSLSGFTIGATHQIWVRAPLLITITLIGTSASFSWFRHKDDTL